MKACLTTDAIRRYAAGGLDGPSNEVVEVHLATCSRCAEKLAALSLSVELLDEIREAVRMREQAATSMEQLRELQQRLSTTLFGEEG